MKRGTFLAFVAPSITLMLVFIALPLASVVVQSVFNTERVYQERTVQDCTPGFPDPVCTATKSELPVLDAAGRPVTRTRFVGLANYAALLEPQALRAAFAAGGGGLGAVLGLHFYAALRFTLTFTFITLPLVLGVGLGLALALDGVTRALRGPIIFVSLLPFIITPVIGALSIRWLFEDDGILTRGLESLLHRPLAPLAHGWSLELLMMLYRVWSIGPFAFIVFYAGLQTLNADQLAAAVVDGASRWQRLRYVILPHLAPLLLFVSLIHLMDAYRVFDEVVGFASQAHVISLQWLTFELLEPNGSGIRAIGRASASSMLTIVGVAILLMPLLRRFWQEHRHD
jgi:multiple sugar transport system permease protein